VLAPFARVLFYVSLAIVALAALVATWRHLERLTPLVWLAMLMVTLGAAPPSSSHTSSCGRFSFSPTP
jgi:hypothetical protein